MINFINLISMSIIPILMTIILFHGFIKKIDIYEVFVEGAREGFNTSLRIMPYLIGIFLAIGIFKESGAMNFFITLLSPVTNLVKIPREVIPLIVMRPISGSGALGIVNDVVQTNGADSIIGRIACTMMGSSETIFYTMAIYFGAIGIKRARHTMIAALISHIAAVLASVWICRIVFA